MLRDRWPRDVESGGDIAGRSFLVTDEPQDLAAAGFGDGSQGGIHFGVKIVVAYVSVN
jgi:hypothetical protein